MNKRPIAFLLLGLLSLIYSSQLWAQNPVGPDDCDFYDASAVQKAALQHISDSMDLVNFVPAPGRPTLPCIMPSSTTLDVTFNIQPDKIFGFFNKVENADQYLVILSEADLQPAKPVDGIYYRAGSTLGSGIVIANNTASAFVAMDLKSSHTYRVTIFAANSNCSAGIKYNTDPAFSGIMKTTGDAAINRYYGNLHSHSSYSDGNQDNTSYIPSDDYAFAKDAQCLDFLGIAEHNHYSSPHNPGMHVADYHLGLQQAQAFTDSHPGFLALYGMEFGVIDNGGHVVVYGIDSLFGWETLLGSPNYDIYVGKYDYSGANGLFNTVNRFKSKNAFAYAAHPQDDDYGNLLGVQYQPLVDSALIGTAVESGPAFSTETGYDDYPSTMSYLQYYKKLLAKGYRVGPLMDHDNHNMTFGRTARSRLVVMSPSLQKDDFMKAMRSLSFYASHSCTSVMDFQIFGTTMGNEIQHANAPAMVVAISDVSASQQPAIKIYRGTADGNLPSIIATGSGNSFSYTDDNLADGTFAYYFTDISIGGLRTISAPIWYHRDDNNTTSIANNISGVVPSQLVIQENPVKNSVLQYRITGSISGQKLMMQIKDMYGRLMLSDSFTDHGNIKPVNIAGLPAGVYVLHVFSSKGECSKQFVKY